VVRRDIVGTRSLFAFRNARDSLRIIIMNFSLSFRVAVVLRW